MIQVTSMIVKCNGRVYGIQITVVEEDYGTAKVSYWAGAQEFRKEKTGTRKESTRPAKEKQGS